MVFLLMVIAFRTWLVLDRCSQVGLAGLRISGWYLLQFIHSPRATFPAWSDQWCILGRPTRWPLGQVSQVAPVTASTRHCLMLWTLQQVAALCSVLRKVHKINCTYQLVRSCNQATQCHSMHLVRHCCSVWCSAQCTLCSIQCILNTATSNTHWTLYTEHFTLHIGQDKQLKHSSVQTALINWSDHATNQTPSQNDSDCILFYSGHQNIISPQKIKFFDGGLRYRPSCLGKLTDRLLFSHCFEKVLKVFTPSLFQKSHQRVGYKCTKQNTWNQTETFPQYLLLLSPQTPCQALGQFGHAWNILEILFVCFPSCSWHKTGHPSPLLSYKEFQYLIAAAC